jgi:F0F1-type ATP synthase alpha subunit
MRKIFYMLIILMPAVAMAQSGSRIGEGRERLEAIQIAYLTKELSLSSQDAEKFWPFYNKYQDELKSLLKNGKDEDVLNRQQQALDIRKKYKNDFVKILGQDRTNKLFEAENKFREMVKRELQNRQKRRPGGQR